MFSFSTVAAYSMSTFLVFMVTKYLTIITSKCILYIDIFFYFYKAYFENCWQTISFDVFREVWGVCISVFFSCDSLAFCIKRSPARRIFILGSPALLIMVLCNTNRERRNILSDEWIVKNLGTYGVWLR